MKPIIALCIILTLAGCETYKQDRSAIDSTIASLVGKPVSAAVQRLGVPVRTSPAGTSTVYVWSESNVFYPGESKPMQCEIRLMVDASENVMAGEHEGNNFACTQLAKRISPP